MDQEPNAGQDEEPEAQGPRIRIGAIIAILAILFLGMYTVQHPDSFLAHLLHRAR